MRLKKSLPYLAGGCDEYRNKMAKIGEKKKKKRWAGCRGGGDFHPQGSAQSRPSEC